MTSTFRKQRNGTGVGLVWKSLKAHPQWPTSSSVFGEGFDCYGWRKLGRKGFIWLIFPQLSIVEGSQDRNSNGRRQELMQRLWRGCCLLACCSWLAQPVFQFSFSFNQSINQSINQLILQSRFYSLPGLPSDCSTSHTSSLPPTSPNPGLYEDVPTHPIRLLTPWSLQSLEG